ncbi:MAG: hypothetical protein KGS72_01460 [Cyanobacteria bacterium REEB67]|nr:hypothetical protein [Cyanobacteria bacterium REEB67]
MKTPLLLALSLMLAFSDAPASLAADVADLKTEVGQAATSTSTTTSTSTPASTPASTSAPAAAESKPAANDSTAASDSKLAPAAAPPISSTAHGMTFTVKNRSFSKELSGGGPAVKPTIKAKRLSARSISDWQKALEAFTFCPFSSKCN